MERKELTLHGHSVTYLSAGEGPTVVLIHGMTASSEIWRDVMPRLAEKHTVIAPDLLGHGGSAKPRGDYSLGAYASGIRDLLIALGHESATVVGHSLGGGIAMQLAYQFPERLERLVLVSSGGLGREVSTVLRAAALPGAELVLPLIAGTIVRDAGVAAGRLLAKVGWKPGPDISEIARGYGSLADAEARSAFLHSVRSVIDPGGQKVTASDRLYLAEGVPTLLVWGREDRIIPVEHGRHAHEAIPGSVLEVIPRAGHFPQLDDPSRFVNVLSDFIGSTEPAEVNAERMRARLLGGAQPA